jgi:predicted glycosyltransferase
MDDTVALRPLRIWVDITNSPHVVIFRPLIARMRERGHSVTVTARDFAQTLGMLERFGIDHTVFGSHGGGGLRGKAKAAGSRIAELTAFARQGNFDLAVAHGSTDQPVAARIARIPQVTMFDYEFAKVMHHWNGRWARRVIVPDAIPEEALAAYGMRPPKLLRYPGLKEEYYLADHIPDPTVADELGLRPDAIIGVLRPAPEVTLYHRGRSTELFSSVLDYVSQSQLDIQVVVLPRTDEQRQSLQGRGFIVPERPVDGPTLVQLADFVVSAGGTMNREAVALGVPAYTPFAGTLGAVDARLIAEGRLHRIERADEVRLERRDRSVSPPLRDPDFLVDAILDGRFA